MTKLKICGLYREEDISYINSVCPDFAGFVINFPKSHRNLSIEKVAELTALLSPDIKSVGVIVNQDISIPVKLLNEGIVDIIQLHGNETPDYIREVQKQTGKPVIKAFTVNSRDDLIIAQNSPADYILLDKGKGCGEVFDWSLLENISRPYFLAGGLNTENLGVALDNLSPFAVDLSSGAETDKVKDFEIIKQIKSIINSYNNR